MSPATLRRHVVPALLAASLALNAMAAAGFAYRRHHLGGRADLEVVARRLGLDHEGQQRLSRLRRAALASIRRGVQATRPASLALNHALAERPAGDAAFGVALDGIAAARRGSQEELVKSILEFRDGLPPRARARFVEMAEDPAFVFVLLGLQGEAGD